MELMRLLKPREGGNINFKMPVILPMSGMVIRHDKPLPSVRVFGHVLKAKLEVGRFLRPLNNLCADMVTKPVGFVTSPAMWKPWEDKPDARQQFVKLFKAAKEARGDAKGGLGYGHPAHKGFFAGRACKRRVQPVRDTPPPIGLGIGAGGWFAQLGLPKHLWHHPTPPPAPLHNTYQREKLHQAALERQAKEHARYKLLGMKYIAEEIEGELIAEQLVSDLMQPGANVCKLFAEYADKIKTSKLLYEANCALTQMIKGTPFRLLGNGHFSRAFLGPDGFVYKTNINHSDEDSWFGYAVNCMLNPNPHVPQIYQIESAGKSYCARMEVLTPPPSDFWDTQFNGVNKFWGFRDDDLESVFDAFNSREFDGIKLMQLVQHTEKETGGSYDIHHENIMLRQHGDTYTIVLTDPLSYGSFNMRTFERKLRRG